MKANKISITSKAGYKVPAIRYDQTKMETGKTDYPLFIFLHGAGEGGDGSSAGLDKLLNNGNHANLLKFADQLGFLVLAPQFVLQYNYRLTATGTEQSWIPDWYGGNYVDDVVEYAKANLPIDPSRIYLTGLSSGGGGTWDYLIRNKGFTKNIAAGIPICAAPQTGNWDLLVEANTPVWAFHANDDKSNPVTASTEPVAYLNKQDILPAAQVTVYPTGGHGIWGTVYNTRAMYDWALSQVKGDVEIPVPAVKRPLSRVYFEDGESWTIYDNKTYSIDKGL